MTFRLKVPKDLRSVVRSAVAQGWVLTYNGKHAKLTSPDGSWATPIPGTSGATDLMKHIKAQLRKHGVEDV